MKRMLALLLAAVFCLSLAACGSTEESVATASPPAVTEVPQDVIITEDGVQMLAPEETPAPEAVVTTVDGSGLSPIVIDGSEVPITDYFIEQLLLRLDSETYRARTEEVKALGAGTEFLEVADALELSVPGSGSTGDPLHLFVGRVAFAYADSAVINQYILLVIDYDTGDVYDTFDAADDWADADGVQSAVYGLCRGPYPNDSNYDDGELLSHDESRLWLSEAETKKMTQQLHPVDPVDPEYDAAFVQESELSPADLVAEKVSEFLASETFAAWQTAYTEAVGEEPKASEVLGVLRYECTNFCGQPVDAYIVTLMADIVCGDAIYGFDVDTPITLFISRSGTLVLSSVTTDMNQDFGEMIFSDDAEPTPEQCAAFLMTCADSRRMGMNGDSWMGTEAGETITDWTEDEVAALNTAIKK